MCGLAGYLNSTLTSESEPHLQLMVSALNHRGPDDAGAWSDNKYIALGHARLAIQDLSPAGHQPMPSASGRYVIAFNGEIYNHLELRGMLESDGLAPKWRGHSDTETLLACFESWGIEKTLMSTVGMFAIALWDSYNSQLTLARDRLGEKPLYWGWQNGNLLFGSELKALKAHPAFNANIDRSSLALFLRHNYIPAPYSIYEGIEKLNPGTYVTVTPNDTRADVTPLEYWSYNKVARAGLDSPLEGDSSSILDTLESRLSQSIRMQMLADVPLGAFLSGGIDSSLIVALMQQQTERAVKTFTIGFNEVGFNEAEFAATVSRHLGTEHTEIYVESKDALDVIPLLPQMYCEPFADSSQIPTFLVSHLAKQKVTVALSGDAGDELFGGYNPYQFAPRIWKAISKCPLPLRRVAAGLLMKVPLNGQFIKLLEVAGSPTRESFYHQLMSHWKQPLSIVRGGHELPTILTTPESWPQVDTFEEWMMAIDAQTYMVDDILVKVDRAAMANSLETRVPFLDHRVVEMAWRLPADFKIRQGKGKWALREILHRHIPKQMFERPKKGFSIPVGEWLRGPLRSWAESLLDDKRLLREGFFNPKPIHDIWQHHLQGKTDHSTKLWGILMFQAWLEQQ